MILIWPAKWYSFRDTVHFQQTFGGQSDMVISLCSRKNQKSVTVSHFLHLQRKNYFFTVCNVACAVRLFMCCIKWSTVYLPHVFRFEGHVLTVDVVVLQRMVPLTYLGYHCKVNIISTVRIHSHFLNMYKRYFSLKIRINIKQMRHKLGDLAGRWCEPVQKIFNHFA